MLLNAHMYSDVVGQRRRVNHNYLWIFTIFVGIILRDFILSIRVGSGYIEL